MNDRQLITGYSLIWGIILLAAILGTVWLPYAGKMGVNANPQGRQIEEIRPYTKGLANKTYGPGGSIRSLVEADSYMLAPRQILVFNFKLLNEIRIENVRVKHYLDDNSNDVPEIIPIGKVPTSLTRIGSNNKRDMPSRAVIDGLVLEIFRADNLNLSLVAERVIVDKKMNTKFHNARLENGQTGKVIMSNKIVWGKNDTMFSIPGKYCAETAKGRACGKGIKVDLDFAVSLL